MSIITSDIQLSIVSIHLSITSLIARVNRNKSTGPNTDPCGTSRVKDTVMDKLPASHTLCRLPPIYCSNNFTALLLNSS